MLKVSLHPGKRILALKASGLIQADDIEEAMPEFEKLAEETCPLGILYDWTELKGWSEEAESIRFLVRIKLRSTFQRVAILRDDVAWDAEVARLQEVTQRPVRRFPPADLQSALAWLDPTDS